MDLRGSTEYAAIDDHQALSSGLAKTAEPIREVARRIVTRSARTWADPVMLTDGRGTAVGVVRVVRVLEFLATLTARPMTDVSRPPTEVAG